MAPIARGASTPARIGRCIAGHGPSGPRRIPLSVRGQNATTKDGLVGARPGRLPKSLLLLAVPGELDAAVGQGRALSIPGIELPWGSATVPSCVVERGQSPGRAPNSSPDGTACWRVLVRRLGRDGGLVVRSLRSWGGSHAARTLGTHVSCSASGSQLFHGASRRLSDFVVVEGPALALTQGEVEFHLT